MSDHKNILPRARIQSTIDTNIGAVEIKDSLTDERASVYTGGALKVRLDPAGTITEIAQAADDDSIPGGTNDALVISKLYGYDGSNWERVITDAAGRLLFDLVDEATREVGRVRIWDGTDEALVTAGKGLVVSINEVNAGSISTGVGSADAGSIRVTEASSSAVDQNELSITGAGAGDRTQLPNTPSVSAVTVQADVDNEGYIYIGGSAVTNNSGSRKGITLGPGEIYGPLTVNNTNLLCAAADVANDKLIWLAV